MTKTYDFDAWYAANETSTSDTRPLRFGGRLWQIPVDPPAAPLLRIQRALRLVHDRGIVEGTLPADIANMMDEQRLLVDLVGQDLVDQWLDAGATASRLSALTWRLYRHYVGAEPLDDEPADAEGEPPARETGATSSAGSSTTGQ